MPRTEPRLYTITEAGRVLSVSRAQIYRLIDARLLRAVNVPGIYGLRIRDADLDAYLRKAKRAERAANDGLPKRSRARAAT